MWNCVTNLVTAVGLIVAAILNFPVCLVFTTGFSIPLIHLHPVYFKLCENCDGLSCLHFPLV